MRAITKITAITLLVSTTCTNSVFAENFAFEAGSGDEGITRVGVAYQLDWEARWLESENWFLGGYTEFNLSHWDGNRGTTGNHTITEAGITPVFRYQQKPDSDSFTPYLEIGIGAHFLSDDEIGDRDLSTHFQFGDHLALGTTFGSSGQFDISYRFQHYSNANIETPNPGVNFHLLRLGYKFE